MARDVIGEDNANVPLGPTSKWRLPRPPIYSEVAGMRPSKSTARGRRRGRGVVWSSGGRGTRRTNGRGNSTRGRRALQERVVVGRGGRDEQVGRIGESVVTRRARERRPGKRGAGGIRTVLPDQRDTPVSATATASPPPGGRRDRSRTTDQAPVAGSSGGPADRGDEHGVPPLSATPTSIRWARNGTPLPPRSSDVDGPAHRAPAPRSMPEVSPGPPAPLGDLQVPKDAYRGREPGTPSSATSASK